MKGPKLLPVGVAALVAALMLVGCGSSGTTSNTGSSQAGASSSVAAGAVLPVDSNPIVNNSTDPVLEITYAAVEDNVDPASGKAIDDRLELTLRNTGPKDLTGIEVYYEMTDVTTGQREAYYQPLDGLTVSAGGESTVFFDNETAPGHYPENQFSLYRSSVNQVDVSVQVSATGAQIATASATKGAGTGEQAD